MNVSQPVFLPLIPGRPRSRLVLALLASVLLAGCIRIRQQEPERVAPLPKGEQAVRLLVQEGPSGGTLALMPVYINGQGPFSFALDTGASHSVIDLAIARQLNLSAVGRPVEATGVASATQAVPVQVNEWRVGQVALPAALAVAIDMPEANRRFKLQGLLGSDVLSRFEVIQIDYKGQMLIFRPGQTPENVNES